MKAGGGKREARGDTGGRGTEGAETGPATFSQVMREQGMAAPPALDEALQRTSSDSAEAILNQAEQLLERVLGGECESRDSALDLLTVDALVTRALIVASRDPDSLASFTAQAMKRISTR